MGVDFSHCHARWSDHGFLDFRRRLAKETGMDLDDMVWFGGNTPWRDVRDPIKFLLNRLAGHQRRRDEGHSRI